MSKLKNELLRKIIDNTDVKEINGREFWLRKFDTDIHKQYGASQDCIKESKMKVLLFNQNLS